MNRQRLLAEADRVLASNPTAGGYLVRDMRAALAEAEDELVALRERVALAQRELNSAMNVDTPIIFGDPMQTLANDSEEMTVYIVRAMNALDGGSRSDASLPHKPGECACCDWHR